MKLRPLKPFAERTSGEFLIHATEIIHTFCGKDQDFPLRMEIDILSELVAYAMQEAYNACCAIHNGLEKVEIEVQTLSFPTPATHIITIQIPPDIPDKDVWTHHLENWIKDKKWFAKTQFLIVPKGTTIKEEP